MTSQNDFALRPARPARGTTSVPRIAMAGVYAIDRFIEMLGV